MTPGTLLLADILVHATPLIMTGLSVAIAFRAGVFNIGADGQLLVGAAAAAAIGVTVGDQVGMFAIPIALGTGALVGGVWASIAAVLRARFGVLDVISTIMLNFIAVHGVSYLVRGPLQESTHVYPQTDTIAMAAQLPRLLTGTRLHIGVVLALILAGVLWWIMRTTAVGFRLRATGANPFAARSAGMIEVDRVSFRAFVASGMLAGTAGAVEVCGVTFSLYENLSPGYGYTAIAVALLAALNPAGIILTGIVFGALETGAGVLQRDANVPATLASVIEASIILAVIGMGPVRTWWHAQQQARQLREEYQP
jgi:ABC-type uncharacterized transport system permease subunit